MQTSLQVFSRCASSIRHNMIYQAKTNETSQMTTRQNAASLELL